MKTSVASIIAAAVALGGRASADDRTASDDPVVVEVSRSAALWHQACPVPEIDGVCEKLDVRSPSSRPRSRCSVAPRVRGVMVARDPRKVRGARAALQRAIDAFEHRDGQPTGDEAAALHAYAVARTLAADRDFEAFLALELPANLTFDPDGAKQRSAQRVRAWIVRKVDSGRAVARQLEGIVALRDEAAVAAAARIAQIHQAIVDALLGADSTAEARRSAPALEAFCDAMAATAEPFEQRAVDGFAACLARSDELGVFTDRSRLCERELSLLRPEQYPLLQEHHADPGQAAPLMIVEPPTP